ncbi:hypothetical protein GS942_23380 [Rhodococcus hoagii]|nr:hypothetical protein [Prescottella equi]NKZ71144.1 hypothetical protein [Prescottella equi]
MTTGQDPIAIVAKALGDKIMHTNGSGDRNRAYAAHVVAALTNAGHVIVELPEGTPDDDGQVWFDEFDVRVDCTGTSRPHDVWVGGRSRSAAGLEHQAAEYLAAARVAEGGDQP